MNDLKNILPLAAGAVALLAGSAFGQAVVISEDFDIDATEAETFEGDPLDLGAFAELGVGAFAGGAGAIPAIGEGIGVDGSNSLSLSIAEPGFDFVGISLTAFAISPGDVVTFTFDISVPPGSGGQIEFRLEPQTLDEEGELVAADLDGPGPSIAGPGDSGAGFTSFVIFNNEVSFADLSALTLTPATTPLGAGADIDFTTDLSGGLAESPAFSRVTHVLTVPEDGFVAPEGDPIDGFVPAILLLSDSSGTDTTDLAIDNITVAVDPIAATVFTQPDDLIVTVGESLVYSSITGPADATLQWSFNGVPLVDGPGVSGATTGTLTVSPSDFADTGLYTLDVIADGSAATSVAAQGTVLPSPAGVADLDGSGSVDVFDLLGFISLFVSGA